MFYHIKMGAIFSRGCTLKVMKDLGLTCPEPLCDENSRCGCWFNLFLVLFLLVFYVSVFSSLVIGSQALSLYGDVKNITNNGTCATMGTVNTYFLVTGIILVAHSSLRIIFDISASCWYWLQNSNNNTSSTLTEKEVTVTTFQDMTLELVAFQVDVDEPSMFVRWFNKVWDFAFVVPLALSSWGLYVVMQHSDARECDPSAWDIFHLHVLFIFGYILSAIGFYSLSVCVFHKHPEPNQRTIYTNLPEGDPMADVEDMPPVFEPLGSGAVNPIVDTTIPLLSETAMLIGDFNRLIAPYPTFDKKKRKAYPHIRMKVRIINQDGSGYIETQKYVPVAVVTQLRS